MGMKMNKEKFISKLIENPNRSTDECNIIYDVLNEVNQKYSITEEYREIPPQNPALAGYIRCFWGSDAPFAKKDSQAFSTMVIPDACADIIYSIDHTKRTILGRFCGVSDVSFISRENPPPGHVVSTFGIRFYAWTACAFSGTECMLNVRNEAPAAVILDLMLPGMTGEEALLQIKKECPGTAVLIASAKDDVGSRISLLKAGADDYLTKPFDTGELLARLEAVLRRSGKEREEPDGTPSGGQTAEGRPDIL